MRVLKDCVINIIVERVSSKRAVRGVGCCNVGSIAAWFARPVRGARVQTGTNYRAILRARARQVAARLSQLYFGKFVRVYLNQEIMAGAKRAHIF